MMESVHLSSLLGRNMTSGAGDRLGRLDDVIVRLRGDDYPLVTGVVAKLGNLRFFLPASNLGELAAERITVSTSQADLRPFERREGEVLLRTDILGHRLVDVEDGRLLKAGDLEIEQTDEGWEVRAVDTRPRPRFFGKLPAPGRHNHKDWKQFEPLIGHVASARARAPFRRLRRLKPAQLADLIEQASPEEGDEILEDVHSDPELEADVFEELDPDIANRLFEDKSDAEVAEVFAHMRADDAADAISELPQDRRAGVLEHLPPPVRTRILVLLGYNPSTAGGMMGVEYVSLQDDSSVGEAIDHLRAAISTQSEALTTIYTVDAKGRMRGSVSCIELLRAEPTAALGDLADHQAICVAPETDLSDVALLMADYNLVAVPVVDEDDHLVGLVTVDDVLEAIIPEDWRRRNPTPRHEHPYSPEAEEPPEITA